ncbi:TPA: hypothetical protein GRI96_24155 [Vibrio parahaemolyticus]|nr:hypothetical protein [Vibrio parahaemolyticus]ELA7843064.1 hypothetical protein [Vibrio parahaemolyticus]OXD26765.1 hypothetical protein CA164_23245 [Vibrio parahaemolyticus]HAS6809262.1 hypothetical protein [Vibrio parahaemolyticus]HAS6824122.1 hypothetical protein [Vibrio parahaemolyticus]
MLTQHIRIKEYTSASIIGRSTRASKLKIADSKNIHADLNINFLKFSAAMVKANTTSNGSAWSQAYDVMLSALTLFGLLDYKQSSVCLKDGFRDKFRDFSKSGRTGELGQAINFIFAQEKLGYKYIFDFDEFLRVQAILPKSSGGTPDYVMLGKPGQNVSILESKGSSTKEELTRPELRAKLQGAMDNQCIPGTNYLRNNKVKVSNSFASVVEFAEASEHRDSVIHFADPEYDEYQEQDYSRLIKSYYLRWLNFLLEREADDEFIFGNQTLSQQLDILEFSGEKYFVQKHGYRNRYSNVPVRYGVSSKVIELISVNNYHALYNLDSVAISLDSAEIFPDGTIAVGETEI